MRKPLTAETAETKSYEFSACLACSAVKRRIFSQAFQLKDHSYRQFPLLARLARREGMESINIVRLPRIATILAELDVLSQTCECPKG